jgi:hypothetical protein
MTLRGTSGKSAFKKGFIPRVVAILISALSPSSSPHSYVVIAAMALLDPCKRF